MEATYWCFVIATRSTNKVCFVSVCCRCRFELTDDVDFVFTGPKSFLFVFWSSLSEVSAWDDCDVGSGVHSEVNLFAVDLDVCVAWVLDFQRVDN